MTETTKRFGNVRRAPGNFRNRAARARKLLRCSPSRTSIGRQHAWGLRSSGTAGETASARDLRRLRGRDLSTAERWLLSARLPGLPSTETIVAERRLSCGSYTQIFQKHTSW